MNDLTRAAEQMHREQTPFYTQLAKLLALIDDYDVPLVVFEAADRAAVAYLADPGDVPEVVT